MLKRSGPQSVAQEPIGPGSPAALRSGFRLLKNPEKPGAPANGQRAMNTRQKVNGNLFRRPDPSCPCPAAPRPWHESRCLPQERRPLKKACVIR